MRKSFTVFIVVMLFISVFCIKRGFSENINTAMDKAVLSAWGETFTKIIEEKTNVPASSAAKIAGYISAGDYKNGLFEFFKLANDVVYSSIPVIGTAKFVVELESTLINVWKQYIDWYLISSKWSYFKTLNDSEKEQWLNGYIDIPELEFGGGAGYLVNNKYDIRTLFKKYWENAKSAETYMDGIKQIGEMFEKAKYLSDTWFISPNENSTIDINDILYLCPCDNNMFRFILTLPDGKTASFIKKISIEEGENKDVKLKLTDFSGVDWSYYKGQSDSNIKIKVQAAVWDSSGLVESVMGSEYVSPKEKILMNVPNQEKSYVENTFSFNLKTDAPTIAEFYMPLYLHFSYKLAYNVNVQGNNQSSSENITGTTQLTFRVDCANKTATDDNGLAWSAECGDNSVKIWLAISGMTVYLNNIVSGSSVSGSITSTGTFNQVQNVSGYNMTISMSNFSGYTNGSIK